MVNATAFPLPDSYKYISNQTQFDIIKASVNGLKEIGGGLGGFLGFGSVLILVPTIVYLRTQKIFPTVLTMIFMAGAYSYYGLLDIPGTGFSYSVLIVPFGLMLMLGFAIAMSKMWQGMN